MIGAQGRQGGLREQERVNSYFEQEAAYWAQVYQRGGVQDVVYQERLRITLALVDGIGLPPKARVLEVGSGAGFATVALARRGFEVEAIDSVQAMVDRTRIRTAVSGVAHQVRCAVGDVHALAVPDATFDLVLALGVLPWLPAVERPLREMRRVLRPGGSVIVSVDHRWGLSRLVDPVTNPVLRPVKVAAKRALGRPDRPEPRAQLHSTGELDSSLAACGVEKLEGATLGFGPLRLFGWEVLPRPAGLALHRALQGLAEHRVPLLRAAGSQYLVLGRKRA
jgi:ubiquinone/menaquinone biosynthesis C-methylase UbiE